jgi:hypothetical protein
MLKATRITDHVEVDLNKSMKEALSSLWTINGHAGLWKFGNAVKDDAKSENGDVIAEYGNGTEHNYRASFIRASELENVMRTALNLQVHEEAETNVTI